MSTPTPTPTPTFPLSVDTGFAFIDRTEPDSPTSTTPTATLFDFRLAPPSDSDDIPPAERLKRIGRQVYKDVWDEFYDWEAGYCADILGTIPQSLLASKRQVARVASASVARLVGAPDVRMMPPASRTAQVTISITDAPSTDATNVSIPVISVDAYPPHPKYESCPPASRSALLDPWNLHGRGLILSFLPYADEEGFAALEYQAKFRYLEWEAPNDPDVEIIQIEAVRRLLSKHDIDPQDIDRMKIFNKKIRFTHNTGLQWDQSQRDVLHWPGAFKFEVNEEKLPTTYCPNVEDLRTRLTTNLKVFCPSINCLHSPCETHGNMHTSTYIPSRKPQTTSKDMILSEGVPCGVDCFRHISDYEKFLDTMPPLPNTSHYRGSLDIMQTVLGIAPDLFPCQLSAICLKPCNQAFAQRLQLFPDSMILTPSMSDNLGRSNHQKGKKAKLKFVDEDSHLRHELLPACNHPGPCTSNSCPCWTEKQHCSLMCRCGIKCTGKGAVAPLGSAYPSLVNVQDTKENAFQGYALFVMLCEKGKPCNNTPMQCLASKPIEVKLGSYGLGAFACQNMKSNAFLGTYVGHIMSPELADCRLALTKHTSHNYLFEISEDHPKTDVQLAMFDAAHLGNATRFLNHADGNRENVEARNVLVIGEHQLGFFTKKKVKAGEELFLDYGRKYWES